MKKFLLFTGIMMVIGSVITVTNAQYNSDGYYRTPSDNTNYNHFVRDNTGGAAVYINQIATMGPILRLSSGIFDANKNVKFTVENNGNVGIGTTTPGKKLDVNGDINFSGSLYQNGQLVNLSGGSSVWNLNGTKCYYNAGNIGIGTTNPLTDLQINKTHLGAAAVIRLSTISSSSAGPSVSNAWDFSSKNGDLFFRSGSGFNMNEVPEVNFANRIKFSHGGKIYAKAFYSLTEPAYYLDPTNTGLSLKVKGKIESHEIECLSLNSKQLETGEIKTAELIVDCDNLADYVFDADYPLPSLNEVSTYINKNSHLPGMPSASEVKENGMNVAEMNNLLLQKVEELTLYMIEQNQRIDNLEAENNQLRINK